MMLFVTSSDTKRHVVEHLDLRPYMSNPYVANPGISVRVATLCGEEFEPARVTAVFQLPRNRSDLCDRCLSYFNLSPDGSI